MTEAGGAPGFLDALLSGAASTLATPGVLEALLLGVALLGLVAVALLVGVRRRLAAPEARLRDRLESLERAGERTERAVRDELAKSREEAIGSQRHLREEVVGSVAGMGDSLVKTTATLTESNEARLRELRSEIGSGLQQLREENTAKLEAMRATVEEKLQGTLEKRLGEAFRQVSERLEKVHQGLGEMQTLANGVGDLKKMLTNVKTRGTWGEIQLGELLDSVLSRDQYARNVATVEGSNERVEFAIRLPGQGDEGRETVWLPIDAKFPQEDYHRLVEAEEQADRAAADAARRALEGRVRDEAKKIREKYVCPPATTDFAILFLPTEGLYAEVLRSPGLVEKLQQEWRVVVAGPTTCAALLNSLQMGFRTLAIQKRSDEVWSLLGAVRTQFGKFGDLLDKVDKKLREASNTIEDASRKTRHIERRLGRVEALPEPEASRILPELSAGEGPGDA